MLHFIYICMISDIVFNNTDMVALDSIEVHIDCIEGDYNIEGKMFQFNF